ERGEQLDANAFVARGHALMELNRFAEALSAYETAEPYLHNPDSALFYNILRARVLAELPMDADDIARRRSAIAPGVVARMRGDRRLARPQLVDLVARFPKTPVIHVDAAMFAVIDGDAATAHALCRTVTVLKDASECVPAIGAREFNLALGHAFWLLGRRVEAEESFRRSGYRCSVWYESTMPAYFGTARDRPGGVQRIA